ncbi:hypothetical protein [Sphingomonas sp. T9W2]|uniref:hypothetical protein n=1 Tax=Sphingomonas sp. T9W2 TaxID=3143183 RepID=UPI0031F5887F
MAQQDQNSYPFSLPIVLGDNFDLTFEKPITILVGENGSEMSTLLEAVATMAGLGEGGSAQGMAAVGSSLAAG